LERIRDILSIPPDDIIGRAFNDNLIPSSQQQPLQILILRELGEISVENDVIGYLIPRIFVKILDMTPQRLLLLRFKRVKNKLGAVVITEENCLLVHHSLFTAVIGNPVQNEITNEPL
jgi:hypothetical protein